MNPVEAREIFLRSALVEGQWRTRHHFFEDNQPLRAEAAELEERTRRRDLVVDDQVIYDFYDARVPADITSGGPLRPLVATAPGPSNPDLLTMTMDDLVVADPTGGGPRSRITGRAPLRREDRRCTSSRSATASHRATRATG